MTTEVDKITKAPKQNELIDTVNKIIDNLGSGGIIVDDELSTTSENPVQNKVITGALEDKQDVLTAGDNITITSSSWTPAVKNSNLGNNFWTSIAYGDTKFVAIANAGYISTSTDRVNWTVAVQDSNLGNHIWNSIAYDGTKFVAISYYGHISTSTDGVNWTTAVQDSNLGNNFWLDLAYDGTKFVALGSTGYISTSTDGTNWTVAVQDSNLGDNSWYALTYDGTKFVALGFYGYTSTSTDGINWTPAVQDTNLGNNRWRAIAYDGTKFVALGSRGYTSTSTDGINWTTAVQDSNLGNNFWLDLAYDGTKFVALGDAGYISIYSATIISADVPTESTVSGWGFTKNTGTVTSVNNIQPVNGNVTLSIPQEVFWATYGTTTYQEVLDAFNAGKTIFCAHFTSSSYNCFSLNQKSVNGVFVFSRALDDYISKCSLNELNGWSAISDYRLESASNKVTSISSSSTDTQYPSALAVMNLLQTIYPVGSVYLSTNSTCPLANYFGTWSLVSSGRALWTGYGSNGGSTISAGLPNITGFIPRPAYSTDDVTSGSFYNEGGEYGRFQGSSSGSWHARGTNFDASRSSSIYGNSTTVQPPAYVVNVWRRTA